MDKIDELLTRGVDRIYPSKEALEKVLRRGKRLTLYLGVDPSGDKLHIGHMVALMKLKQFQTLGHNVILLIGDFTGTIGDPTDRAATRKKLTREQVWQNAKTYKKQASKILRFSGENAIEIKFNSQWLSCLNFSQVIELAGRFTVQQMLERDMFKRRLERNKPISLHEFLYPLMQGYDSVAMDVDLEIGGTDQTFNMLVGRALMKEIKNKEKFVLTVPLLTDNKGVKIGKTEGNIIALTAKANDLYGMIMALPDEAIGKCFEYITDLPYDCVLDIKNRLKKGEHQMKYKKQLAVTLVRMLNGKKSAAKAQKYFEKTFQKRALPKKAPSIKLDNIKEISIIDLLTKKEIVKSRSQAKRLIRERAVDIDEETVVDPSYKVKVKEGMIIKVGKYKFYRIKT